MDKAKLKKFLLSFMAQLVILILVAVIAFSLWRPLPRYFWEIWALAVLILVAVHLEPTPVSWGDVGNWLTKFGVQLAIVTIAATIGYGILNWYLMTPAWLLSHNTNASQVFSTFWSLVGGIMILLIIFHFEAIESKPRAVLIALMGAGLGWLIGMYISPRSTLEQQEFAAYKGALVGILSGYVLGKVQSFINDKFKSPEDFTVRRQAYTAVFVVSALLTIGAIYNVRAYGVNYVKVSIKDFSKLKTSTNPKNPNEPDEDKDVLLKCDGSDPAIVFVAESTLSDDSSVTWEAVSSDSIDAKKVGGNFANSQVGLFKPNDDGKCEGTTYILARSNSDPTISGRYTLKTKKEPPENVSATGGNQVPAANPAEQKQKAPSDSTTPNPPKSDAAPTQGATKPVVTKSNAPAGKPATAAKQEPK
jgi:hypothetical protein